MKLKIKISNAFFRKAFCIILVLLLSVYFFVGAAVGNSCDGGAGCLNCAEPMHPHLPAMNMDMAPHGCLPLEQNDTCRFEIGPDSHRFQAIIPTVMTDQNGAGHIFSTIAVDDSPAQTAEKFILQPLYYDTIPTTPIYLIIQSLLC
jgi:hypothetical protein